MIFHGDQPILVKKICAEGQIVHGDYTGNGDRLGGKGGAHGHGLAGHGKGIFAVRHLVCHVNAAHGQRLQRIVLVRGHGDGDLNPLGGLLVIGGDGAVLGLLHGDWIGVRLLLLHHGGSVFGLVQGQGQVPIALSGDHAGGGVVVKSLANDKAAGTGIDIIVFVIPNAKGRTAFRPVRSIDRYAGNGAQPVRSIGKGKIKVITEISSTRIGCRRILVLTGGVRFRRDGGFRGCRGLDHSYVIAVLFHLQRQIAVSRSCDDTDTCVAIKPVSEGNIASVLFICHAANFVCGTENIVSFCIFCSIHSEFCDVLQPINIVCCKKHLEVSPPECGQGNISGRSLVGIRR